MPSWAACMINIDKLEWGVACWFQLTPHGLWEWCLIAAHLKCQWCDELAEIPKPVGGSLFSIVLKQPDYHHHYYQHYYHWCECCVGGCDSGIFGFGGSGGRYWNPIWRKRGSILQSMLRLVMNRLVCPSFQIYSPQYQDGCLSEAGEPFLRQ